MAKLKPSLIDNLGDLRLGPEPAPPPPPVVHHAAPEPVVVEAKPPKPKKPAEPVVEVYKTPLYLTEKGHAQLRDLAFEKKIWALNDLICMALDQYLRREGKFTESVMPPKQKRGPKKV